MNELPAKYVRTAEVDAVLAALDAAGENWITAVPADARILHHDDEHMRDAIELGTGHQLRCTEWGGPTGTDLVRSWHLRGWSAASAAAMTRPIPLSAIRAGTRPAPPDDGDHVGWS